MFKHRLLWVVPKSRTDLGFSLDLFITAKEAQHCTARTTENYRYTLGRFIEWLEAQSVTSPHDITPHHRPGSTIPREGASHE